MADSAAGSAGLPIPLGAARGGAGLVWVPCRLRPGHGVASGRNPHSPYPTGTIALQTPFFQERGIDLSPFFPATLNLEVSGGAWRLQQPDAHVVALRWTEQHPPETFSFWNCRLRVPAADPAAAIVPAELPALIYHPHPETKRAHHQPQGCLEVLAPWLGTLADGQTLELGVEPRRCRLIHPARLRARLLEFLKFRVLAAQEEFFIAFQGDGDNAPADAERVRRWLRPLWPEALDLSDADLQATLAQARHLYVN